MRAPDPIVHASKGKPKRSYGLRRSPVFGPVTSRPAFQAATQHAIQREHHATAGLRPVLRHFPTLSHYTPTQRERIIKTNLPRVQAIAHANGRRSLHDVLDQLGPQDRRQYALLHRAIDERRLAQEAELFRHATGASKNAHGVDQARAFEKAALNSPLRSEAKPLPKHKGFKLSGQTRLLGVGVPGLHQGLYFADQALSNLARPAEAVTGAAYAAQQGKPIAKGAIDSFTHKHTITSSDILRSHGMSPTAAAIVGTLGDVAVDPLNLVGAEATVPGSLANRGVRLRIGFGGKAVRTSGRATAALSRNTGLSALATSARETPVAQALGKAFHPGFRPKDVSPADWAAFREEKVLARAAHAKGSKEAEDLGSAYRHELKRAAKATGLRHFGRADTQAASEATINALERASHDSFAPRIGGPGEHSIHALPGPLKSIALHARGTLRDVGQREYEAGVLGEVRKNYVPHQLTKEAQKEAQKDRRYGRSNPFAKRREDARPVADINAEFAALGLPAKFHQNLPKLIADRAAKSTEVLAARQFARNVVGRVGRPFSKAEDLQHGEAVYKLGHPSAESPQGFTRVGTEEKSIIRALESKKEGERLVVLPEAIGEGVKQGPIARPAHDPLGFTRAYDRALGGFKSAVTVFNVPAYELRNMTGDLFKSSTGARNVVAASRIISQRARRNLSRAHHLEGAFEPKSKVVGLDMSVKDFIAEAESHGVIGGGHYGHELDYQLRSPGRAKQVGNVRKATTEGLRRVGSHREDIARLASYLTLRQRGHSPIQAAKEVAHHIIDYGDMSPFEATFMKRAIPFYTFAARNASRMPAQVARNPGRYAAYGLAQEEGQKQSGVPADWRNALPGYYRKQLPIPVKVGGKPRLFFPGSPISDLHRVLALGDPKEEFNYTLQGLTPFAKWPLELGQNHSFFFRSPIYQETGKDAPSSGADAPHFTPAPWWVSHAPEAVKQALAGGNKMAADQGYWTTKADYFGRLLPQQNTLTQVATPKVGSRNQSAWEALVSQLTGVKVNDYDADKYALNQHFAALNKLKAELKDMKKLGLAGTPAYKAIQRVYFKNLYGSHKKQPASHLSLGGSRGGLDLGGSSRTLNLGG